MKSKIEVGERDPDNDCKVILRIKASNEVAAHIYAEYWCEENNSLIKETTWKKLTEDLYQVEAISDECK